MAFSNQNHRLMGHRHHSVSFYRDTHLQINPHLRKKDSNDMTKYMQRNYSLCLPKVDFLVDAVMRKNNKKLEALLMDSSRPKSKSSVRLPQISRSQSINYSKKNTVVTKLEQDSVIDEVILSENFWKNVNSSIEYDVKNQPVIDYNNFVYEKTNENKQSDTSDHNRSEKNYDPSFNTRNNNIAISRDLYNQNLYYDNDSDIHPSELFNYNDEKQKKQALKKAYQKMDYKPTYWKYNLEIYRQPKADIISKWRDKHLHNVNPLYNRLFLIESAHGKKKRINSTYKSQKLKSMEGNNSSGIISSCIDNDLFPPVHAKTSQGKQIECPVPYLINQQKISKFEQNPESIKNINGTSNKGEYHITNEDLESQNPEIGLDMSENYNINNRARSLYLDHQKQAETDMAQDSLIEINNFELNKVQNLSMPIVRNASAAVVGNMHKNQHNGNHKSKLSQGSNEVKNELNLIDNLKNLSIEQINSMTSLSPNKFENFKFNTHLQEGKPDYIQTLNMLAAKFKNEKTSKEILSRKGFRKIEESKKLFRKKQRARVAIIVANAVTNSQLQDNLKSKEITNLNNSSSSNIEKE